MTKIKILTSDTRGKNFIPEKYLPEGKNEYFLRNKQNPKPVNYWRKLTTQEINELNTNNNEADNWNNILVTENFETTQIKNNQFFGLIRIGNLQNTILECDDLKISTGITNSLIISCDIGDNSAIHNVKYLSHYIISEHCILFNINEMLATSQAKFGNGIIKDGESEDDRNWIELMNEAGGRSILPFTGIITADAYLWAKYRDDTNLQKKLMEITQNNFDNQCGYYGIIGKQSIIKNSHSIKNVKIGSYCYINGINKLKNLTINSSTEEPTIIGEGVELVNGIIGYGCNILFNSIAINFILGDNSNLKYGARLLHTFLGDNSTISCCEVVNNLIFPSHEQHHNNSFLIASLVMGQSNLAAGATLGSNHNSRANDNEIQAGRGFWPGLCSSIKYSSRFASFTLLAKSDFPAELNISLPFSLINNNPAQNQLEIIPAFWWLYNMYALARNSWKFKNRDKRKRKIQNIEYDYLAPDTIEEILHACQLLEIWTAKASLRNQNDTIENKDHNELSKIGRGLLMGNDAQVNCLEIMGENIEKSRRKILILKTYRAYHAYYDMLHYYAVNNLLEYLNQNKSADFSKMINTLKGDRIKEWINLGGQLIPKKNIDKLKAAISHGDYKNWQDIHLYYDKLWNDYPLAKQKHAYAVLCEILNTKNITKKEWHTALDKAVNIQKYIKEQVHLTRKKDFDNLFTQSTFRNNREMEAVIGKIGDNSFVKQINSETDDFIQLAVNTKEKL